MSLRFRRSLVAGVVVTGAILGTAANSGSPALPRAASTSATAIQYNAMGMSGAVAARALNALSARHHEKGNRKLVNVHFILNWVPNVEFAGLWIAEKYGWWQKAGIHMTFTPWSVSVHPETDVPQRGGNTFGFQAGAAIGIARAQGVPIQALYTDTQRSVFGLTVLNKSHIRNITDLKGKKVGYQSHELYVPETMLASAGLKNADWKPVPVGFDIAQLTQGAVDAFLTFLTNEPLQLNLMGVKNHSFRAADYGYHFYDDVLFSYQGLIRSNPALVKKVVVNVARGFQWAHTHPDQTARITVRAHFPAGAHESGSQHMQQQILESRAFVSFSRDSGGKFRGLMSTAYWRDSINTLYRYHEIKSKPSAATIYTNRFNPYR